MCPTHLLICHVSHSSVDMSCVPTPLLICHVSHSYVDMSCVPTHLLTCHVSPVSRLTQYQKEMLEVFEKEMVMKLVREDRKPPKLTSEKHIANILSGCAVYLVYLYLGYLMQFVMFWFCHLVIFCGRRELGGTAERCYISLIVFVALNKSLQCCSI